jgi:hypothetical protein
VCRHMINISLMISDTGVTVIPLKEISSWDYEWGGL